MLKSAQKQQKPDTLCSSKCKSFRCSNRMMDIKFIRGKKTIFCSMVDGDECIGTKCKFAVCSYRPPQLQISTGDCRLKLKELNNQKTKRSTKTRSLPLKQYTEDDPMQYKKFLNKQMKKNFKMKDFYD